MNPAQRRQVQPRQNGCGCGHKSANIVSTQKKEAVDKVQKPRRKIFA